VRWESVEEARNLKFSERGTGGDEEMRREGYGYNRSSGVAAGD
jgi:hypothetical protein